MGASRRSIAHGVLLVHGSADARAPLTHAKALSRRLDELGKAHELMVIENEGHGFFLAESRQHYYQRLLAFLERHIGQAAGSTPTPAP